VKKELAKLIIFLLMASCKNTEFSPSNDSKKPTPEPDKKNGDIVGSVKVIKTPNIPCSN
jgi:hypothetical protein